MKYIKLLLECLGLFIIGIPLGYVYVVITGDMQFPPSKEEWILMTIFSFIGTLVVFIIGFVRIKKSIHKDYEVTKDKINKNP